MFRLLFRIAVVSIALASIYVHLGRRPTGQRGWFVVKTACFMHKQDRNEWPYDARGPEYALYGLWDYWLRADNIIDPAQPKIVAGPHGRKRRIVTWDEENGRLTGSGLDYLNLSPEDISELRYDVVLLSYGKGDWTSRFPVPYIPALIELGPSGTYPRSAYNPWVRPAHLVGLPVGKLRAIEEYGRLWGVACDGIPIIPIGDRRVE